MGKKNASQTLGVLAFAGIIFFLVFGKRELLYLSAGLLFLSLFDNPLGNAINRAWLGLSELLGKISGFAALSAVFYLVVTPIAVLWRLFGRASSAGLNPGEAGSFYSDSKSEFYRKHFEKPY